MSVGWPYHQFNGRHDPDRDKKDTDNVATYFSLQTGDRVLHIGAGDNPLPGSLAEDIEQYNNKNYPQLLAAPGGPISQYLSQGHLFDKVVIVNIKLGGTKPDYGQIFELAASVMKSGATIVWAAFTGYHQSMAWAIGHEPEIINLGLTKLSPTAPGRYEDATSDIRALPASVLSPVRGMVPFSNTNAVQVVWKKN